MFLDVIKGRYFALPRPLEPGFRTLAARAFVADDADPSLVDRLRRIGVITAEGSARTVRRAAEPSIQSWMDTPPPASPITLAARLWATRHLLATRAALRRLTLSQILEGLAAQRAEDAVSSLQELAGPVTVFEGARRWAPVKPVCLLDSLSLLAFLNQRDLTADLVFGVIRQPFAAHCWVQAHGVVLNDRLDRVAEFTPILVV